MAELQRTQQRRNRLRRGVIVGVVVAIAIGFAVYTGTQGGSSKKATTSTPTTAVSTTGLVAHSAPSVSTACDTPAGGAAGTGAAPASGNAVSIVPAPAHVPFPNLDGSSPRYSKFSTPAPFCIDTSRTYTATIKTDVGNIALQLLPKYAPVTVNDFVFLAGYHYYDGVVFHRVVTGFVDQAGDPTGTGGGGAGFTWADELPSSGSAYKAGTLALANSGPNTNNGQFFIVVPGGGGLSPNYTVFGQVTSGMDVVQKINSDGSSSQAGTPTKYHKILSVSISES